MFKPLKTRKGRLENKIKQELFKKKPSLKMIISFIEDYHKDNLNTIIKLKRDKKIEMNKINGALKQCISSHGPITKQFITSAGKRIYGALLAPTKKVLKPISVRDLLIGLIISSIIFLILFG